MVCFNAYTIINKNIIDKIIPSKKFTKNIIPSKRFTKNIIPSKRLFYLWKILSVISL